GDRRDARRAGSAVLAFMPPGPPADSRADVLGPPLRPSTREELRPADDGGQLRHLCNARPAVPPFSGGTPPHTAAACADRQLLFRILRSSRGATLGPCTAERHGCQLSMDRQWSIETSRRTGGARLVSSGDRSRCRTALGCPLEHVSLCRTVPRIE